MGEPPKQIVQIMLIGDSGVGKTSLLHQIVGHEAPKKYAATIGVDFKHFEMKIQEDPIKLQIWDTAGQERFRTVTSSYYRKADGIICVFDLCSYKSFENCRNVWLKEIDYYGNDNVTVFLVGNRCDDQEHRAVEHDQGVELSRSLGIKYHEVSAMSGQNVQDALFALVSDIRDRLTGKSTTVVEINKLRKQLLHANEVLEAHQLQLQVLVEQKRFEKISPSNEEVIALQALQRKVEFTGKLETVLNKGPDDLKKDIKKIEKDVALLEKKLGHMIHSPRKRDSIILDSTTPNQLPPSACCAT